MVGSTRTFGFWKSDYFTYFRVIPLSAHAAFDKAGDLFGIKVRHVPTDKKTLMVDIWSMRRYINSNTCLVPILLLQLECSRLVCNRYSWLDLPLVFHTELSTP